MKNKTIKLLFWSIIFVFAVLFFGLVSLRRALWYDEAIYIGMAKWFFSFGKIGLLDALRPPLFPMILGFFWKFGLNPRIFGIVMNFFLDILSALIIYKISSRFIRKEYALLSTALFLINYVVLFFNSLALTESLATFLMMLSIYVYLKKKYLLSGFFIGLTFLTRFPFGIVLIPILLQELLFSKRNVKILNLLKINFAFIVTLVPYFIFNYFRYNHHLFYPFQNAVYTVSIAKANKDLFFYAVNVLKTDWLFIFAVVPFILLIIQIFNHKLLKKKEVFFLLLIAISFLLPFAYFTHTPHKEVRYALSFIPFLSILSCYGLYYLFEKFLKVLRGIDRKKARLIASVFLLVVIVITGSSQVRSYIYNSRFKAYKTDITYNHELNAIRENLTARLNKMNNNAVLLTNDVSFSYYTNDKIVSIVFPSLSVKILHIYNGKGGFIVLNSCQLKCYDNNCLEKKKELMNALSNYTILFRTESFGNNCSYIVYKNK